MKTAHVLFLTLSLAWMAGVAEAEVTQYVFGLVPNANFDVRRDGNLIGSAQFSGPAGNLTFTSPGPGTISILPGGTDELIPPSPQRPPDNSLGQSRYPRLGWHPVAGATAYETQLSGVPDFSQVRIDLTGLADTTCAIGSLPEEMLCYWRVRGVRNSVPSAWSPIWSFRTKGGSLCLVYPGDANNDGIVDARDILPLGTYYGLAGPARTGGTLAWQAQALDSTWTPEDAGYADCDGDGQVSAPDVSLLVQHWSGRHTPSGTTPPEGLDTADVCRSLLQSIGDSGGGPGMDAVRAVLRGLLQSSLTAPRVFLALAPEPNPFTVSTTIRFALPQPAETVRLVIYDAAGREVYRAGGAHLPAGMHDLAWDGRTAAGKAAGGVYLYALSAGERCATGKVVVR